MFKLRVFSKVFENRILWKSGRKKHIWTADKIVKSPFDDIVIPEMPIYEYVWKNLERWSNKTAVVCAITERKYTYQQVYKQSQILGANLRKKIKIKDGDTVAVMLPNSPEYPTVVFGVLTAGGIVTALNPIHTAYEIQRQITIAQPKLIITAPETMAIINEATKNARIMIPKIVVDVEEFRPKNTVSFKELVEDNNTDLDILKEVKINENDVATLLYSSGTTGLPKGVELTHKNIVANCEQRNASGLRLHAETSDSNQDSVLAYLPMFHSYGLSNIFQKLSNGLKLVTLPRFHPNTFIRALENHDISLLYMVPPTVLFLAANNEVSTKHFKKLKCVVAAAAPLPLTVIDKFLDKVNRDIHFAQGYGLTEMSPLVTISPIGFKDYSTAGFALPNCELRVVNEQMHNLGPNEFGELVVKGPNVMKGYKYDPEANEQVFVDKEWLRTGDLVKMNENGSVVVADRLKELIKVNAHQVPPAELENVIKDHPYVLDVAVIGIPDEQSGERPKAFIILNEGFRVSPKDIMDYVSEKVAPFKRLKEVEFVNAIPKNPTGKTLRRLLFEQHMKS